MAGKVRSRKPTKEVIDKAYSMRKEGKTFREICDELQCSYNYIASYAVTHKWSYKILSEISVDFPIKEMEREFVEQGCKQQHFITKYGLSPAVIRRLVVEFKWEEKRNKYLKEAVAALYKQGFTIPHIAEKLGTNTQVVGIIVMPLLSPRDREASPEYAKIKQMYEDGDPIFRIVRRTKASIFMVKKLAARGNWDSSKRKDKIRELNNRDETVLKLLEEGKNYQEVATEVGLSRERVRQLVIELRYITGIDAAPKREVYKKERLSAEKKAEKEAIDIEIAGKIKALREQGKKVVEVQQELGLSRSVFSRLSNKFPEVKKFRRVFKGGDLILSNFTLKAD